MKYYQMNIKDIEKEINTNIKGLTLKEAQTRLIQNGKNKLNDNKKESNVKKFIKQFKDLMIIILLLAAIISFFIAYYQGESYLDSLIIILIVIINALISFIEEKKATNAIEALKKLQNTKVKVKRDNEIKYINSQDLVVGDLIYLEAGDKVPADARLITSTYLKVDESSLTGESEAVNKNIEIIKEDKSLSETFNMVYSGTNVVYGKGSAYVVRTGMNTEIGKIANSLNNEIKELSPLQQQINNLSQVITLIIGLIIFIMLVISIINHMTIVDALLLAISLAVAAIPEGLPAIITIILAISMTLLARKKAIVRKMASIETLGCTQIICSDKTGTITKNQMELQKIYYNLIEQPLEIKIALNYFTYALILNNDVIKNGEEYLGDPTEIAIYKYIEKHYDMVQIKEENKREAEIPFDSERKMMSILTKINNKRIVFIKGSFDSIIKNSTKVMINNKPIKLTKKIKAELIEKEQQLSQEALRIIAYAYKETENNIDEDNLTFLGLVGLIDPPRDEVKDAVATCKQAHMRPIMITGDSLNTAIAIAKKVGILKDEHEAITGEQLDKMSFDKLQDNIEKYNVYARVSPINKLNIVKAWKSKHKVVAMTGDGVNDAPALKASDIGIGMGISGSDVSKGVADIVLADDSFATIIVAIKEGRKIYDNIRNVLAYLLIGNLTEVIVVFIGILLGYQIFFPIQLLFINLITDSLPAIALAFESPQDDIMQREVRAKNSTFFTPFFISKLVCSSLLKSLAILLLFSINLNIYDLASAESIAFLCIILLELFFAFSCKNIKASVINKNILKNKYLNLSIIILILIDIILFASPFKYIFNISSINIIQFSYCLVIVLIVLILDEVLKPVLVKYFKD